MKEFIYATLALFCLSTIAGTTSGQTIEVCNPDSVKIDKPPDHYSIVFDPGLTMRSGAESIITIHKGIASVEDKFPGTSWFNESTILGKVGGISTRLVKYWFIDLPVDYFSIILSHEYFGHGARYRELNIRDIQYGYDFPPPYGPGGGYATNNRSLQVSYQELISIWTGGVEIHSIINRDLGMRWISTNKMYYREASQYFWSFQIYMNYIQKTNEDINDGTVDNDIRAYIRLINAEKVSTEPSILLMSVKDLKSKTLINVANPFVFFSIYSIIKTYLWGGDSYNEVPSFKFGNIQYLPVFRTGITPFGVEYHLESYLRFKRMSSMIDIRYGDQTFYSDWGGIGAYMRNIYYDKILSIDTNFDLWKQPGLLFGSDQSERKGTGLGFYFSGRCNYNLVNGIMPVALMLELGYKSTGFLEGFSLNSSPIIQFGISFIK
jgi:hypothetical protein